MAIRPRTLSEEEIDTIRRLAHSRTAQAWAVQRAPLVWLGQQGQRGPAIAGSAEAAMRDLGGSLSSRAGGHRVLERPSASLSLGAASPPPTASSPWDWVTPDSCIYLADAPLSDAG